MILERPALEKVIQKTFDWWGYFEDDAQPPYDATPSSWEFHALAESAVNLLALLDRAGIPYERPVFPYASGLGVALKDLYGLPPEDKP